MANFINIKDIILNDHRIINVEQIVSVYENGVICELRMSNGDRYTINDKENKKLIQGVLNADIQLSSKRTTERTDRSLQRPAK